MQQLHLPNNRLYITRILGLTCLLALIGLVAVHLQSMRVALNEEGEEEHVDSNQAVAKLILFQPKGDSVGAVNVKMVDIDFSQQEPTTAYFNEEDIEYPTISFIFEEYVLRSNLFADILLFTLCLLMLVGYEKFCGSESELIHLSNVVIV